MNQDIKGCTAARSEQETEWLMCEAMAEHMRSEGMDASAEQVAEMLAEAGQNDNPPQPEEAEQEVLERMAEYQSEYAFQNPSYVVRGALLRCQFGSHCKKLNLPRCHGVYARKQPMAHKNDCIGGPAGPMINVPSFGICSCPTNPCTTKITLPREAHRNADGSLSGAPPSGVAVGAPCIPVIVQGWNNAHSKMLIGKEGEPALLTSSTLTCLYGGLIDIWRSGQEDGGLNQGGAVVENVDEQTDNMANADGEGDMSPGTLGKGFPSEQIESCNNSNGIVNGKTPAARLADKLRGLSNSKRPNTVAVIRTVDGKYYVGYNKAGIYNSNIQKVLDYLGNSNLYNRQCAEVNAISRAFNDGADLRGATISIANVREALIKAGLW